LSFQLRYISIFFSFEILHSLEYFVIFSLVGELIQNMNGYESTRSWLLRSFRVLCSLWSTHWFSLMSVHLLDVLLHRPLSVAFHWQKPEIRVWSKVCVLFSLSSWSDGFQCTSWLPSMSNLTCLSKYLNWWLNLSCLVISSICMFTMVKWDCIWNRVYSTT